ncbi:hypothetical protein [Streptomyces stelliscabiei]|uniref:Uncharacterized protein n=1 Tax=Streptomyces stelliscabiei TaxID=146820 RepID=A0A8I0PC05_9ACTN|nr:hypothetical protein [Streptomyces stelliscabiei]MBE1599670.1 hypothetical protein [Streptomyces stelliscabiei]MDX2519334.1 hypothetical protein [Streptomyces stelliscabiei]MDX2549736.1 hypothetical protein [Streptomyces stelliscabiei]MDX2616167.1 hypothetical protein [Streptomyces stelliscabiei]MDX2634145.1 hypothetical protein [Streptomyces stelliscabiei]
MHLLPRPLQRAVEQPRPEQRRHRRALYCNWHRGLADTCELIRDLADQGSGHGTGSLYACARCREQHGLTPAGGQS